MKVFPRYHRVIEVCFQAFMKTDTKQEGNKKNHGWGERERSNPSNFISSNNFIGLFSIFLIFNVWYID